MHISQANKTPEDLDESLGASLRGALKKVGGGVADILEFLHLKQRPLLELLHELPHVSISEIMRNPRAWKGTNLVIFAKPEFVEDRSHSETYLDVVFKMPREKWVTEYLYRARVQKDSIWVISTIPIQDKESYLIGKLRIGRKKVPYLDLTEGWVGKD